MPGPPIYAPPLLLAASTLFSFASPLWLLCLIPWGLVAIYALIGRPEIQLVPFLDLWPASDAPAQVARQWRFPPPAVAAILAAALLSILAAAAPRAGGAGFGGRVTIILDRGITMSARQGQTRRFAALAAAVTPHLVQALGGQQLDCIVVPGAGADHLSFNLSDFPSRAAEIAPTAVDTSASLAASVRKALVDPQGIVLLLSDQSCDFDDPRLIHIVPTTSLTNIGIAAVTVRSDPAPQAMVRIMNDSSLTTATLHVTGSEPEVISLPRTGESANFFVNLHTLPDVIEASISPGGDIDADDHAWAVRGPAWPNVTAQCEIDSSLQKILQVYARHRRSSADSPTVPVFSLDNTIADGKPAVFVLPVNLATISTPSGEIQAEPTDITNGIDWTVAAGDAVVTPLQPPLGFGPIVRLGSKTLVAIRTEPARQVWIGFRSEHFAATPDFVVFWAKVLDWIAGYGNRYDSTTVRAPDRLWPGIYHQGSQTIAADALPPRLQAAQVNDWKNQLDGVVSERRGGEMELSSPMLLGAIALLLAAVAKLPNRN